jgi:two-component system CheB/CheR fusion protein
MHARMMDAIVDNSTAAYLAVDSDGILIFANSAARRMLDVGEADVGRPFQDLPISYRPTELRSHIDEVRLQGRPLRLDHQDHQRRPSEPMRVTIDISPLLGSDGKIFAVLLCFTDTTRTFRLQQELEAAHESLETTIEELQSANEELETTNEELQSTNEELETTNEELQSTNEELETTNEELRSTNEELETTNEELRRQSEESTAYRTHSEAVLGSIGLGIIVLDREARVLSWNHWNEAAWGLRADEATGQPLATLDLGLPVQMLQPAIIQAIAAGEPSDITLDTVDRRGRPLRCRVRVTRLSSEDRSDRGAILLLEQVAGG